jgi:hypothetical protein
MIEADRRQRSNPVQVCGTLRTDLDARATQCASAYPEVDIRQPLVRMIGGVDSDDTLRAHIDAGALTIPTDLCRDPSIQPRRSDA